MRRHIPITLLILLAVPLAAQSPAPKLQVPFQQFTLANGLDVILHQDKSVPMATVNIWYHVGSANEKPGRTGFAHLFEHIMFEGSKNVKEGVFDTALESAGASNNGSTTNDRTNYYIDLPVNAMELALYLDSDRMGYLLDTMTPQRVDGQRDVVKNERRQSYENRPYGMASLEIDKLLWPSNHPYNWPVIGYMEDLTAASHADVTEFFKQYYAPNNASIVIAGDIDLERTKALVEKWFHEIPAGAPVERVKAPPAALAEVKRATLTDRVALPRIYLSWITPPLYAPGDAALDVLSSVLSGGKNSRLYKRLVYDTQIAQDVYAVQQSAALGSAFMIVATARPGHTAAEMQKAIDEELEKLRREPPAGREVRRALNQIEAAFYRRMERVSAKADQMNAYHFAGWSPDSFGRDLARYTSLTPADVQSALTQWLPAGRRVELTVNPEARR
jgi:zinc protease